MKPSDEKDAYARTKLLIDIAGPLLTFAAILIGMHNFSVEQNNSTERERKNQVYLDVMEFKRKNWEKQQEIYIEIATTIGGITNGDSSAQNKDEQKYIDDFERLYYGKAAFVADSAVANNMGEFHYALTDYRDKFLSRNDIKKIGFALIASCKASSTRTWKSLNKVP